VAHAIAIVERSPVDGGTQCITNAVERMVVPFVHRDLGKWKQNHGHGCTVCLARTVCQTAFVKSL